MSYSVKSLAPFMTLGALLLALPGVGFAQKTYANIGNDEDILTVGLNRAVTLIEEKKARIVQRMGTDDTLTAEVMVQGTDVEHRVRLMPDGDKCTCPWYSKHQNERGPCKHILAAHLLIEGES